jgi:6-hydroxymethylpterin diphosphokinase MptE-like
MNETLARNIEALTTTGAIPPPVARAPFQLIAFDSDGDPQLRTPDGRTIRLGSARNPLAEAEALVRAALESAPPSPAVAVIGAGTGAILEVLATTPVQHILVFEPDAELALAWLSRRSWVEMILANRLRLLVGPEYLGTANAARAVAGVERLPIVAHPVLTREYPDAMLAARSAVDRVVRDAAANANARERFEDLAFRNTFTNLPSLLGEADAGSLAGAFEGRPAIVVGAGPSLDVNVDALRPFQSSCLIVAADTAVVPCVKGGLTPHLAVALDPSLDNARHLTRMAVPESVHLVCEASVDASVPRAFGGRTFFFRVGRHAPWPWLEAAGVRLATLDAWGSVVTSALDLAVRAGCSPIIFAGLDLAFTRGQNYCRHTPLDDLWTWRVAAGDRLDDLWAAHRNARPIVMERAIEGGETPTAAHLVAFRDWIRDYAAARPHIRFVNGTGAGILRGTGIEIAALGDLATSIPTTKTPDITQTVSRIRAAARPPAQEANVLARVAAVSPLELLEGHSAPEAAAERMDVAEVQRIAILRTPPAAMTAHRGLAQTFEDGLAGAPLFLPDAARALRAIDPGQADAFVEMSERNPTRARECLDQALEAIRNVLLRELNATQGGTYHDARANVWNHVPAVVQVEWPPDVRPLVETATKAIHDAIRSSDCPLRLNDRPSAYFMAPSDPRVEVTPTGPSVDDAPVAPAQVGVGALVWQWAHVAATVLGADATVARVIGCLRASVPPLLPSSRAHIGLRVWLASAGAPDRTAGVPVVPFLHGRAVMRALSGLLTLDPASLPGSSAGPSTGRPFHLFALPCPWTPADASFRTRRVPWSVIVEPDVLTDRGLGACRLATRLSETHALLTRFDRSGSYVVDERGHVDRSEAWPRRIDGEIGCGANGRLAWSWEGAQYVLFRRAPGASALAWDLSVAPMHALDDGEGSAYLATTDGLWRWRAEGGPQPVASGPHLVALHRRGMDVSACRLPTVLADGSRQATDRVFDWKDGTSALVERHIAPGEACFDRSTQGPWTAETRMDASAVRITHVSGPTFWLACSGPRSAAWAGRSLVVTLLGRGDVLLFRDLLDLVEPLVARSTIQPPSGG